MHGMCSLELLLYICDTQTAPTITAGVPWQVRFVPPAFVVHKGIAGGAPDRYKMVSSGYARVFLGTYSAKARRGRPAAGRTHLHCTARCHALKCSHAAG